jgi:hypothetical protein
MKNDKLSLWPAVIEVENVRFTRGKDLGIDFSNEIDAWSQLEFRYRHQMKQLRQYGTLNQRQVMKDGHSLFYSFRQKID